MPRRLLRNRLREPIPRPLHRTWYRAVSLQGENRPHAAIPESETAIGALVASPFMDYSIRNR